MNVVRPLGILLLLSVVGCGSEPAPISSSPPFEERVTLSDHRRPVTCLAISPDNRTFISGDFEAVIRIWNLNTAKEEKSIVAHQDWVSSVDFSADGQWFATGGQNSVARLWDAKTLKRISSLSGHTKQINTVDFHPTKPLLITGSGDGTVKLWNPESEETLKTFTGHSHQVYCARFSPDGQFIASVSGLVKEDEKEKEKTSGDQLKLWDVKTGQAKWTVSTHTRWVTMLAFHPNGKQLFTVSYHGENGLQVWDVKTGKEESSPIKLKGSLSALAISPQGKHLLLGYKDGLVEIVEWESGNTAMTLKGHPEVVSCIAVSSDGKTVITAGNSTSSGGLIKVWQLREPLN